MQVMTGGTMISWKEVAVVGGMAALMIFGWNTFSSVDRAERSAQTQMVTEAVQNAALTCYAVEGAYPMSLQYLRDNYGLSYDTERYRVSYDAFSSNLFPEIRVTEVETGGSR